jgi:hypothetical protein
MIRLIWLVSKKKKKRKKKGLERAHRLLSQYKDIPEATK